ncbi:hypothetical protein JTB14_014190 [Gonioctena quinquepunctata]|nr:hypothetical protein JTB14_014190 [Gonioctena quinquepunctata]
MVKPRVNKTTRGEIPQELYEQAAYDVINGNAKVRTTAKKYGMCHISLRRFVIAKKNNKNPQVGYHPHNRVFTYEQEQQLGKKYLQTQYVNIFLSPTDETNDLIQVHGTSDRIITKDLTIRHYIINNEREIYHINMAKT